MKTFFSHGDGSFNLSDFKSLGENVIFEKGVLVFHPETISIGNNVYIGHNTILKGYYSNEMSIGDNSWIGQGCFFHSAGGLEIGDTVGIGPMVKILTSQHDATNNLDRVMYSGLKFHKVIIGDGADIGVGSVILPGVVIGKGAIIGAGSVVTKNVPEYNIYAGVPARCIKQRKIDQN